MILKINSEKYGTFECLYDCQDHDLVIRYQWGVAKRTKTFYAYASLGGGKQVFMHKLIMGAKGSAIVDHVNGNGLDNRRSNLRMASKSGNAINMGLKSCNSTGYKGVSFHKRAGKYTVCIKVNYKYIYGGLFDNPIDAARKYDELALQHHGEFAKLNFGDTIKSA